MSLIKHYSTITTDDFLTKLKSLVIYDTFDVSVSQAVSAGLAKYSDTSV